MVNEGNGIPRVAIACQGGGSHTAFTAGVLKRLLKEKDKKFEIVALSGTSGGAICALLAWYGLLRSDKDKSISLLDSFWNDISASSFWDLILNEWVVWTSRMKGILPIPDVNPYFYPPLAQQYLKELLEKYVEFGELSELITSSSPTLFVGAVDVLSGKFKVFENVEKDAEISADAILASAAVPTFLRAVDMDGHVYWDGLFSQNPPVRDFVLDENANVKPDEIWVIQINPEERNIEPKSMFEINDRLNELSGNLSLNQELDFIETVNKWVDAGYLPDIKYKHIEVKRIEMLYERELASKMDRSPEFIHEIMSFGEQQAEKFLAGLS